MNEDTQNTRVGRPSILTEELTNQICEMTESFYPLTTIADFLGITRECVYEWLRRGEKEESGIYQVFSYRYKKAKAKAQIAAINNVVDAGKNPKQWAANMRLLESSDPDNWARVQKNEISGPGGSPLMIQAPPQPDSIAGWSETARLERDTRLNELQAPAEPEAEDVAFTDIDADKTGIEAEMGTQDVVIDGEKE